MIDAYRIESAPSDWRAILSATYIAGYRIGMLASGAGALFLAAYLGTQRVYLYSAWRSTYLAGGLMLIGILTDFFGEPTIEKKSESPRQQKIMQLSFSLFLFSILFRLLFNR